MCQSQSSNFSLPPLIPSNHKFIFYICNSFCFVDKFMCSLFLDSTYKRYHMIFVFLCLTYFTQYDNFHSV